MAIKVGDHAPDFTLVSDDKSSITLSSYCNESNVVLLFFPLAFTGVCTKELCDMRDDIGKYEKFAAQVLAISVDSVFTLNKFKTDQGFNFPLLSDFNKDVSRAYDALYEEFAFGMKGVSKRSAFVIDKQGVVQYAEVLENAGDLPNFSAVATVLASL
ncbi:MAG: redoxin domain-containing protein [Saprospiraceae bacterium]|nr:redoxin domain-containing protein [Saprospiraceae bacterium]MBP7699716.1 redoxin domain-containing protein [Saprospiraceae bacterium]